MEDSLKVKGFFRVNIEDPDGTIVGDSGWLQNQVVNLGFNEYLVMSLGSIAGSKYITHVALGTGTAPGATATDLEGEVEARAAVTAASSSGSKTLRLTATFASADSFVTTTMNLANIAAANTSTGGTIFAGNTYASSSCAVNQAVNVTYDIVFS